MSKATRETAAPAPSISRGFTLVELIITTAITLIIISLATPSFGSLIRRSQVESKANTVFDVFQLSRNMAISQSQFITICPSEKGIACSKKWQDGVMAFIDSDHDRQLSSDDEVINFQPGTSSSTLHGNQPYFTYSPLGTLKGRMGSLITCSKNADNTLSVRLLISQMGRVRVKKDTLTDVSTCTGDFKY